MKTKTKKIIGLLLALTLTVAIMGMSAITAFATDDGEKVCSTSDTVFSFPDFEYINRIYPTVEATGFPYAEFRTLFPDMLTVKYENGKYMVKDVGADTAQGYTDLNMEEIQLTLVDGWWIFELDEEIYSDDSIGIHIRFGGELEGGLWTINYYNGEVNGILDLKSVDGQEIMVHYYDYDQVEFIYYVGARTYNDIYIDGVLSSQNVLMNLGDGNIEIKYFADGTLEMIYCNIDGEWYYYYLEIGWKDSYGELIDAPEGYEDIDFITSIAPTTINCAHEEYSEADCYNPERCVICGIAKEGSVALGHDWNDGEIITEPTCTENGEKFFTCQHDEVHTCIVEVAIDVNAHAWNNGMVTTNPTCTEKGIKTFTCTHNSAHTRTEDVANDVNAHSWNNGVVTTNPTCTEKGVKTYTCTHNSAHTYTEDVDVLGHAYDNACDAECNTCGEGRTPAAHYSENSDGKCDECGESFELSGGAIAGIAVGSTATVGLGGFALFWFVIKKKK